MNCIVCNKEASKRCSSCQSIFYCSPEHQKENWKDHKKICSPIIVIKTDPIFGEQWVAGRDLEEGTLLLNESPALKSIYWPLESYKDSYQSKAICLACGMFIDLKSKFYRCGRCLWPMCNEECGNKPIHTENECKMFKDSGFSFPPNTTFIAPNRIDLAVDITRVVNLKQKHKKIYADLMNLQSTPTIAQSSEDDEINVEDASTVKFHFDFNLMGISDREAFALPWVRKLNSFRCENRTDRSAIHCTYIKASKFSHSCAPNCSNSIIPQSPEFKMQVRTATAVKKGEPLTIGYFGQPYAGTAERQKYLREIKSFVCMCKRCVDPTELDTYMSAVTCSSCYAEFNDEELFKTSNSGFLLPEKPLSLGKKASWKCNRCFKIVKASEFLPEIEKLYEFVTETPPRDDITFYESIIKENIGKVLHKNHFVILKAVEQVTRCLVVIGPMDVDAFKSHLLHQLSVNDITFPGLSYLRCSNKMDLLFALKVLAMLCLTEELLEEIKLSSSYLGESFTFLEYYKNEIADGNDRLRTLNEIKDDFATLNIFNDVQL